MSVNSLEWDVVIAGAGPCGLTLANYLGALGVRALVLEATHCGDSITCAWRSHAAYKGWWTTVITCKCKCVPLIRKAPLRKNQNLFAQSS